MQNTPETSPRTRLTTRSTACKCASLDGVGLTFHGLRHTCVTLMLLNNVPAKVVSERLGHADVAFTLRVYSHILPGMQRNAADGLDEMLF